MKNETVGLKIVAGGKMTFPMMENVLSVEPKDLYIVISDQEYIQVTLGASRLFLAEGINVHIVTEGSKVPEDIVWIGGKE